MDPAIWLCCYLPLLFLLLSQRRRRNEKFLALQNLKIRGGTTSMTNEMLHEYIGEECIVYLMSGQVTGVVEQAENGWLRVKNAQGSELVNLSFVSRIRRYPRKKNGKKVSVVLD